MTGSATIASTLPRSERRTRVNEDGPDAEHSFDHFWHDEHDRVQRALTLALGDVALAAEATDEAFTRAFQSWAKLQTFDAPGGWCYRVGLNWATSWRRKLSRRPTLPIEALDRAAPDVQLDEDDARLAAALAELSPAQRNAVVARHYLDLPMSEVASLLGIAETTVRTHLQRGLDHLRDTLSQEQHP